MHASVLGYWALRQLFVFIPYVPYMMKIEVTSAVNPFRKMLTTVNSVG
jgi:hypothetical protein